MQIPDQFSSKRKVSCKLICKLIWPTDHCVLRMSAPYQLKFLTLEGLWNRLLLIFGPSILWIKISVTSYNAYELELVVLDHVFKMFTPIWSRNRISRPVQSIAAWNKNSQLLLLTLKLYFARKNSGKSFTPISQSCSKKPCYLFLIRKSEC